MANSRETTQKPRSARPRYSNLAEVELSSRVRLSVTVAGHKSREVLETVRSSGQFDVLVQYL